MENFSQEEKNFIAQVLGQLSINASADNAVEITVMVRSILQKLKVEKTEGEDNGN